MSELEFILIAVSMVLAIALGKLLEGIVDLTGDERRYWVHSGWILSRLLGVLLYFWVFRAAVLGQVEHDWTFDSFLLVMIGPITTFMQAHLLLSITAENFIDWRSHFYAIRRRFFIIAIIQQAGNMVAAPVFDVPTSAWAFMLLMGLSVAGMLWSHPRVHAFIVGLYLAIQSAGLAIPIVQGIIR